MKSYSIGPSFIVLLGLVVKSTDNVDIFIQAFNENNGLIGFSNSTLSNIIQSLQSKAELLRTLQSPFEISVDASNDDVFDHYELRIQ
jgi:hypothetical protein